MSKRKRSIYNKGFLLDCIFVLIVLSIARIIIKNIFMSVLNFTPMNINLSNTIAILIVFTSICLFFKGDSVFNPNVYRLKKLSNRYDNKKIRTITGSICLISMIITAILKMNANSILITTLFLIIIPVYEEVIFRQYLWNYTESFLHNKKKTLVIVTILYMVSVFGYWDIISDNIQATTSAWFTIDVVIKNMWTYAFIGAASGIVRYKYNDIYLCIFLHIFINCIIL